MNVFYEEDGGFKVGTVLADNTSSLQVEAPHGKRSKVKANAVMLRFERPAPAEFLQGAQAVAEGVDAGFLWEVAPQAEFDYAVLARDYFGRDPSPVEAAGLLMRLHGSPMHFYKKGKGCYRAAPAEALKAALASVERKRQQAAAQAAYVEALTRFELPEAFRPKLPELLYEPDKASVEYKALDAACVATGLSAVHLLDRCGAIASSHDFHLDRFLRAHFPGGTGFPEPLAWVEPEGLSVADVRAFSIDDVTTTEIDDALSVTTQPGGGWLVGIHISAPALGIPPGGELDRIASGRLSTVYMPGRKITMLPDSVIDRFTLREGRDCPVVSLYARVDAALSISGFETRVERVPVVANLRHDALEDRFNEAALASGALDFPFGRELGVLHALAQRLEAARGKSAGGVERPDYNFYVEDERVRIVQRRRGSPVDKLVAELMILANAQWGRQLADANVAGIYRAQTNGRVRMSVVPAPHDGLGVEQYVWSTSPLRRYVDLLNQRQIVAFARQEPPPYARAADDLVVAMRDFEAAYDAYADFQRGMERYWCLRWVVQEHAWRLPATVLRESLVRIDTIPLVVRVPSLPELAPGTPVDVELSDVDLLQLEVHCRFVGRREGVAAAAA